MKHYLIALGLVLTVLIPSAALSSASFPCEPTGATLHTNWPHDTLTGSGWTASIFRQSIATDATAPVSPSNVLRYTYPSGMQAGGGMGTTTFESSTYTQSVFVGIQLKVNTGFQQELNSLATKVYFIKPRTNATSSPVNIFLSLYGSTLSAIALTFQDVRSAPDVICNTHIGKNCGSSAFFQNISTPFMPRGAWTRIEVYVKLSTTDTSQDGIIRAWVNGVMSMNYTNVNLESDQAIGMLSRFQYDPIWGGLNSTKAQTDTMDIDQTYISRGGTAPSGNCGSQPAQDTTNPNPPTNLAVQ